MLPVLQVMGGEGYDELNKWTDHHLVPHLLVNDVITIQLGLGNFVFQYSIVKRFEVCQIWELMRELLMMHMHPLLRNSSDIPEEIRKCIVHFGARLR